MRQDLVFLKRIFGERSELVVLSVLCSTFTSLSSDGVFMATPAS